MIKNALITLLMVVVGSIGQCSEAALRITEDVTKAKEIAKSFKMPMALVFVGSDWCSFSKKLLEEVLDKNEFAKTLKMKVLFVKIDFPELHQHLDKELLEQHFELKKRFHIEEFPTLVLVDENLEEIARFGYEAQSAVDYGEMLFSRLDTYQRVKEKLSAMEEPNFALLKSLFLEASNLGAESLKNAIVQKGIFVDQDAYFHLEKYAKTKMEGRSELKKEILSVYKNNEDSIKLRLALLDFQERVKNGMDASLAIEPLITYAESVGFKEKDQSFRVHMLIANQLFQEGEIKEALKHANLSLEDAPEKHKEEIRRSIKLYKAEMIAHKDS